MMEYLVGALLLEIPMIALGIILQITKLYYLNAFEADVAYSSMVHYLSLGSVVFIIGAMVIAVIAIRCAKRK